MDEIRTPQKRLGTSGCPVVRTMYFHGQGPGFSPHPVWGTEDLTSRMAQPNKLLFYVSEKVPSMTPAT